MNFCGRCGTQVPDTAMNCPNCGAPMQQSAAGQPAAPNAYPNQAAGYPNAAPQQKRPAGALGGSALSGLTASFKIDSKLTLILIANLLAFLNFALNFAHHFVSKRAYSDDYHYRMSVFQVFDGNHQGYDPETGYKVIFAFIIICLILYGLAWLFMQLPLFGDRKFSFLHFVPLTVVTLLRVIIQLIAVIYHLAIDDGYYAKYFRVSFGGVMFFIFALAQVALLGFIAFKLMQEQRPKVAAQPQYPVM